MTEPPTSALPPPVRPPARFALPPVERFTLANGLPVLWSRRPGLPVTDVQLVVRAGAASDAPAHAGRTALAAALLDEGTASRSAPAIAEATEQLGARLDVTAGWDGITLALHVLTPRLDAALELLGDVATAPVFAPAEVERQRAERLATIAQDAARPGAVARDLFHATVYGVEHPFGVPLGGTAATVSALDRSLLAALHHAHMHAGDAFVAAAGDGAPDALLQALERALAALPAGVRSAVTPPPAVAPAATRIAIADRPGAAQSEVRAGHAGPPRATPDHFALLVLNTVLGGAFTSRLNRVLREEKGYTYGVRSSFAFRRAGGPFVVSVAVATDATADTVREIVAHMKRLQQERVPEPELERARNYLALGFPRGFEIGEDHVGRLVNAELHELGPDYHSRYVDGVRSVSADAVRAAAARYLQPDGLTVAVAGGAGAIAPALEQLGVGPVLVRPAAAGQFRRGPDDQA